MLAFPVRDLELWHALTGGQRPLRFAALLSELAREPLPSRAAYLGPVSALVQDDDPEVRAAAVSVLAGVRGTDGVRVLVEALDDAEPSVRLAAVDALRATGREAPMRWAHVVFHRRADVRRASLVDPPEKAAPLLTCLRADPLCADLARDAPWPRIPLDLLFDLWKHGAVQANEAAELLRIVGAAELRLFVERGNRRTSTEVNAIVEAFAQRRTPSLVEGDDVLDTIARIMITAAPRPPSEWGVLRDAVLLRDDDTLRRRTLASIAGVASVCGWTEGAATLAAICNPVFLCFEAVPLDARRDAARGLWRHRNRLGRVDPELTETLLASELCRAPDGGPDFEVAASIASLLPHRHVRSLVDAFSEEALVAAATADHGVWTAVCRMPPEHAQLWLLDRIRTRDHDRFLERCAVALDRWLTQALPQHERLIEMLDAPTRVALSRVVIEQAAAGNVSDLRDPLSLLLTHLLAGMPGPNLAAVLEAALVGPLRHAHLVALQWLTNTLEVDAFEPLVRALPTGPAVALVEALDDVLTLADAHVQAIARALAERASPPLERFVARVLRASRAAPAPERVPIETVHNLSPTERERIAGCPIEALDDALVPALALPSRGLTEALARRSAPERPHLSACAALVACIDGLEPVARELERFGSDHPDFGLDLHWAVISLWRGNTLVPPLVDAWLHAWEMHAEALGLFFESDDRGIPGALRACASLSCDWVRRQLWAAAASVLRLRRFRPGGRGRTTDNSDLVDTLVSFLDTDVGPSAASMLTTLHATGVMGARQHAVVARVRAMAPDLDRATRHALSGWVSLVGVPYRADRHRPLFVALPEDERERIKASRDLAWLVEVCRTGRERAVHEAALRLTELGDAGQEAMAASLASPVHPSAAVISRTIVFWTSRAALEQVRTLADDSSRPAELRFRLALALLEREEPGRLKTALAAATEPTEASWFGANDWDELVRHGRDEPRIAHALADSDHPHAHHRAVTWLLARPAGDVSVLAPLGAFLEGGRRRSAALRSDAARRLHEGGDLRGLPLVIELVLDHESGSVEWLFAGMPRDRAAEIAERLVDAALLGGRSVCAEARVVALLQRLPRLLRAAPFERLLLDGVDDRARQVLTTDRIASADRATKLMQVADVFAWGVRRGRELTGRMFSVHMTGKREDYGYTPLDSRRIFVTPLPILRGDRHARDVVEGLVLHELGHHMYHRGQKAARVWKRLRKEGLFPLLNLVADEHLERNLRALDADFGDRIKRLDAYAFQHASREMQVEQLVGMLLASSFEVLSTVGLQVAYAEDCVRIESGQLLAELDRRGNAFARFVRALRMGLGNRSGDPRVEAALELFKGGFRHLDMAGLARVTRRLSEIFGGEAGLARGFGGHESIEWDDREAAIHGEGIGDDDVQREVERILEPPRGHSIDPGGRGRRQINVGGRLQYQQITTVERLVPDTTRHREEARSVRRHAEKLRDLLSRLGLAYVMRPARLRGRAFDRSRATAVVVRRDPRMLIAREQEVQSDLFIGVMIDCSGSMAGANLDKAKRFGVLIAEAARGLPGVEARFFGFTDTRIYDAGDARRCAVTMLDTSGGNNDAAALDHVAQLALRSRRKAKLLVMISDGLPTECSTAALRELVTTLDRRHRMCCAQVAVRPLEEICFPHHILLDEGEMDASVRRFAEVVARLVRRALGR